MEQYILKSALVAEIERLKNEYLKHSRNKFHAKLACGVLDNILRFIDTLEVIDPYEQTVQYDSIKAGIQAHAETYSFNIESELFNQLTKEQQVLWRKEIESAFNNGYNQAEKDNELTWEDIKKIEILCFKVDIECNLEEKEHYQEVLKRFKEKKYESKNLECQ